MLRFAARSSCSRWPQPQTRGNGPPAGFCRPAAGACQQKDLHRRCYATVQLSQKRLEEFLAAELHSMAKLGYSTITVERILENHTPQRVARVILKELPARFATRVQQIETTTQDWRKLKGMKELHNMLFTSFKNLRLVTLKAEWALSDFTDVITDLRDRHKAVVPLLAECQKSLKENRIMDDKSIDEWLMKFMNSRIGTEMLTAHYMSLLTDKDEAHVGIVDTRCKPARICEEAIAHVKSHFENTKEVEIQLKVEHPDIEFSFISKYLFIVIEELLKNSIIATIKSLRRDKNARKTVRITVCADPGRVGIKISDKGGGVPFELDDRIWECGYTTTPEDMQSHFQERTPVSGPGFGLPLCRLYCKYLGGSMNLMSMPGVGTDIFIFLNRLDAEEQLHSVTQI